MPTVVIASIHTFRSCYFFLWCGLTKVSFSFKTEWCFLILLAALPNQRLNPLHNGTRGLKQ